MGLVRQAFRPEQSVRVMRLGELDPVEVDMLSILIIGKASTRSWKTGGAAQLTPRGYAGKYRLDGN